jgi:hypothetical protein
MAECENDKHNTSYISCVIDLAWIQICIPHKTLGYSYNKINFKIYVKAETTVLKFLEWCGV